MKKNYRRMIVAQRLQEQIYGQTTFLSTIPKIKLGTINALTSIKLFFRPRTFIPLDFRRRNNTLLLID